jgi:hypothetical protein
MKKEYTTHFGTVLKTNIKVLKRGKIDTLTHNYMISLFNDILTYIYPTD